MKKKVIINNDEFEIHVLKKDQSHLAFELNGKEFHFELNRKNKKSQTVIHKGKTHKASFEKFGTDGTLQLFVDDLEAYVKLPGKVQGAKQSTTSEASLQSPMPGKIFKVLKSSGEIVKKDEPILILEAMKMEHTIKAHKDGQLTDIFFKEGEQVLGGVKLAQIE